MRTHTHNNSNLSWVSGGAAFYHVGCTFSGFRSWWIIGGTRECR